jgi:hypothetical protein
MGRREAMAEIRQVVGPIADSGEYLILAKSRKPGTYELAAQLHNRALPGFPGEGIQGNPDEARRAAQEVATKLGVSIIYEIVS